MLTSTYQYIIRSTYIHVSTYQHIDISKYKHTGKLAKFRDVTAGCTCSRTHAPGGSGAHGLGARRATRDKPAGAIKVMARHGSDDGPPPPLSSLGAVGGNVKVRQTLEASFSALSKPNFASKYSLEKNGHPYVIRKRT